MVNKDKFLRRVLITTFTIFQLLFALVAQNEERQTDSLLNLLKTEKVDTSKVLIINSILELTGDQEIYNKYNNQALQLCEKNFGRGSEQEKEFYKLYYSSALINRGYYLNNQNEFGKAIQEYLKAEKILLQLKKQSHDSKLALAYLTNNISDVYIDVGQKEKAFMYIKKSTELFEGLDDESGKAMAYSNLAGQLTTTGSMTLAIDYYNKAIEIYKRMNNSEGVATIQNNIADLYDIQGREKEAIEYYLKSYQIIKQTDNKNSTAYLLQNIGIIYGETGNIKIGLDYLFKALKLFEELKDKKGMYYALSNIGGIYFRDNDFKTAEIYFLKSIEAANSINYVTGITASYYRLGNIELQKNNLSGARNYFNKAIALSKENENYRMLINSLNSLAELYRKQNKLDSATTTYKQSIFYAEKAEFKLGKAGALVAMANIAYQENKIKEAKTLAEKGFKLCKELGYALELKNAANLLYKIYKTTGNNNEALQMHELYVKMTDSLKNEDVQRAIIKSQLEREYVQLKTKDSIEIKQLQNEHNLKLSSSEKSLSNEKRIRYILILLSLIFIVLALVFYSRYIKKRRRMEEVEKDNMELERVNKERELLMHEIHHRVKNNLQIVSSLLKMPQKNILDMEALEVMDDSRQRIHSISLIHKLLYEKSDLTHINTKEYVDELCNAVLTSFTLPDQRVSLKLNINEVKMQVDQFLPLALILNELLLNSIKYAFNKVEDPEIRICLEKKDDQIVFVFSDNGNEDASDLIKARNSFGTKMIFNLTEQLNGRINVYFEKGTNISINFKAI